MGGLSPIRFFDMALLGGISEFRPYAVSLHLQASEYFGRIRKTGAPTVLRHANFINDKPAGGIGHIQNRFPTGMIYKQKQWKRKILTIEKKTR